MNLTGAYRGSRRRSECRCNSEDTVYVYIYIFDPVIDFLLHYTPLLHWLPIITFIIQFISPTLRQILWCVAQRWSVAGWCRIRGRLNRQPIKMGVSEVAKLLSPITIRWLVWYAHSGQEIIDCQSSVSVNQRYSTWPTRGLHYLALRVVGRKRDKVLRRQFCSNSITFTGTLWLTHDGGLHR